MNFGICPRCRRVPCPRIITGCHENSPYFKWVVKIVDTERAKETFDLNVYGEHEIRSLEGKRVCIGNWRAKAGRIREAGYWVSNSEGVQARKFGMPTLNLSVNVPLDGVTISDILKDASKTVARILGKPESYVMVLIHGGVPMSFGGTEEPTAYGELVSIGGLGPSVNGKLSAAIADILESKLSVDKSRFYILFYDVKGSYFGFNGSTF